MQLLSTQCRNFQNHGAKKCRTKLIDIQRNVAFISSPEPFKHYNVYVNHDPVMTLTYFTTRSTKVANAFEWGKLLKCHLK